MRVSVSGVSVNNNQIDRKKNVESVSFGVTMCESNLLRYNNNGSRTTDDFTWIQFTFCFFEHRSWTSERQKYCILNRLRLSRRLCCLTRKMCDAILFIHVISWHGVWDEVAVYSHECSATSEQFDLLMNCCIRMRCELSNVFVFDLSKRTHVGWHSCCRFVAEFMNSTSHPHAPIFFQTH